MTEHTPEEIEALAKRIAEASSVLDEPVHWVAISDSMDEAATALRAYAELLLEREMEERLLLAGLSLHWVNNSYSWGPAAWGGQWSSDRAEAARLALAQMEKSK